MTGMLVIVGLLAMIGCGDSGPAADAPQPDVPEQCRNVHLDKLAADWLSVRGAKPDPKTRMRVVDDGDGYKAFYIGGFFQKITLKGVKRDDDVQFTEVVSPEKQARVDKGEAQLVRMYVKPSLKDCALKSFVGVVDAKGKEKIPPTGFEFVAFPKQEVTFTFEPAQRTLFLGEAAKSRAIADKQLADAGQASPEHEFGTIPVGLFSKAEDDGAADCTYDMDLYFDDQSDAALAKLPAGEVTDGHRHWLHLWEAPYSGNHHFEMYRYRTCGDAGRERIDIAAIEAVLL